MTLPPSSPNEPSRRGPHPVEDTTTTEPVARPRLLLAEDDAGLRETLAEILSVAFEVAAVTGGREALECVSQSPVDVALFDVQMGEISGLDVVRVVRVEFELQLPCLLMTARPDEQTVAEASRLGVAGLLEKPFRRGRLVESLDQVMRSAYGQDDTLEWFDVRRN